MASEIHNPRTDIRDAFFDRLYDLAAQDRDTLFLTADMGALSLDRFKRDLPRQFINVGICEQSLVSIAAGLSLSGKKVFIYAITSFITQRCYEQIRIDLCGMRLPVVIVGSGPGICYGSDGGTHHAVEDIALMRALPNLSILNPSDPLSASAAALMAHKSANPVYVRLDKGKLPALHREEEDFSEGLRVLKKGRDVMLISTGVMVHKVFELADELAKHNIDAGIIDLYRIKPINTELLLSYLNEYKKLVTIEEHILAGGIGSAICEIVADHGIAKPVKRIAIPDIPCSQYGDREWMHRYYGLDVQTMVGLILQDCL